MGTHTRVRSKAEARRAQADPAPPAASRILTLQRAAGNAATTQLLRSHTQPPAARAAGSKLQRFPATALSAPVDWKGLTASVSRPGEGASGGVYILTSKPPQAPIPKVVAKPVFGGKNAIGVSETGAQLQFGDAALASLLGIRTPVSRVITVGKPEYSNLLSLLRPHQPPRPGPDPNDPNAETQWKELGAAQSFVVMSEVPDSRSAGSFAEKAATDRTARNDLRRIVFDTAFVSELAKICVGDLLLGNQDRMVHGAMNLGNLMISRRGEVHAIDTTAVLPKAPDIKEMVSGGALGGGGFANAKSALDKPEELIEGFYSILIRRMKEAEPKPTGTGPTAPPAWQLFEQLYQSQKARIASEFVAAFKSTLVDVFALVETQTGRGEMKGAIGGHGGTPGAENLEYTTLKANAMYLAGRIAYKDHKESAADAAAYLAYRQLIGFDRAKLTLPHDRYGYGATWMVPADRKIDIPSLNPLTPNVLSGFGQRVKRDALSPMSIPDQFDTSTLESIGAAVNTAKASVEGELGATKTRGGVIGPKRQVPRNRVLAADFLADTYLVGAGAVRARWTMWYAYHLFSTMQYVKEGQLRPSQAAQALTAIAALQSRIPTLRNEAQAHANRLTTLSTEVPKFKRYADAAALGTLLDQLAKLLQTGIAGGNQSLDDAVAFAPPAIAALKAHAANASAP